MKYAALTVFCCLAVGCNEATSTPPGNEGTTSKPVADSKPVAASDNTGVNVRDRDHATKTPLDQNENKADIKLTADIRKRVVDSKMSTAAQNVKIITQEGKVTLRGPVPSAEEKQQIEEIAVAAAGADHVDNQLEVEGQE